jgi:hypothetical protein
MSDEAQRRFWNQWQRKSDYAFALSFPPSGRNRGQMAERSRSHRSADHRGLARALLATPSLMNVADLQAFIAKVAKPS